MSGRGYEIERLTRPVQAEDVRALATLLVEAVESGAAVSFLLPLDVEAAREWWLKTLQGAHVRTIVLVARSSGAIVGTVQLQPAWAPNQPHRGEVVKLLVRADHQGQGLGADLMTAMEAAARNEGFRLLTLDARAGGAAERLYRRLGWSVLGVIPRYALDTDGAALHDATFFYKELA